MAPKKRKKTSVQDEKAEILLKKKQAKQLQESKNLNIWQTSLWTTKQYTTEKTSSSFVILLIILRITAQNTEGTDFSNPFRQRGLRRLRRRHFRPLAALSNRLRRTRSRMMVIIDTINICLGKATFLYCFWTFSGNAVHRRKNAFEAHYFRLFPSLSGGTQF